MLIKVAGGCRSGWAGRSCSPLLLLLSDCSPTLCESKVADDGAECEICWVREEVEEGWPWRGLGGTSGGTSGRRLELLWPVGVKNPSTGEVVLLLGELGNSEDVEEFLGCFCCCCC